MCECICRIPRVLLSFSPTTNHIGSIQYKSRREGAGMSQKEEDFVFTFGALNSFLSHARTRTGTPINY